MENMITLTIRNHNERRKGDFNIDDNGIMTPKTRNYSIWGSVNSDVVPKELFDNKRFLMPFSTHTIVNGFPLRLSAFFKVQRTKFNAFAENAGMEIASFFNCKTCYNCPTYLNKDEISIKRALLEAPNKEELEAPGSLVISMLDDNESLFSFSMLMGKDEPTSDVRYIFACIDKYVNRTYKDYPNEEKLSVSNKIKEDYCYQYLFRDCFGDVDFTSKNSGIIYNSKTNETSISAMFDYGEMFNILYSSKIAELKLNDISSFPDYLKNIPSFIETIEKANNEKIEKHLMSPHNLGAFRTFGDESIKNISFICRKFPNVAVDFYNDLTAIKGLEIISPIIKDASGTFGEPLLSNEEENMVCEYVQAKVENFSNDLLDNLKLYTSPDFLSKNIEFTAPINENCQ